MPPGGTIAFGQLWLDALDRFTQKTGVDPLKHKLAHDFGNVQSLDEVFAIVEIHMKNFKAFRAPGSRWDELREKYFKPIVRALLVVTEAAGELASDLVRSLDVLEYSILNKVQQVPGGKTIFVVFAILLQATKGISQRYDVVLDVFEALTRYLDRLSVRLLDPRGKILLLGSVTRKLVVDTLELLLDIIALAVKLVKHRRWGRLAHYAQSLGCIGGQDDMEAALARLDKLTEYETQATATETYVVTAKIETAMAHAAFRLTTFVDTDTLVRLGRVESADILAQDDPCCMPGTRVDLLTALSDWSLDANAPRIFWLDGLAGTGKSTITRSLSLLLRREDRLGGSFFCSRVGFAGRRDIKRIIPTLAWSMTRVNPGFKENLLQSLSKNFVSYHSNLGQQMQHIFRNPFGHIENDPRLRTMVLIVDALDECTDEALIKEFLTCIIDASPYLPIKFFITSRPERHIRAQFSSSSAKFRVLRLHEIDPEIVNADISIYLTNSLAGVSRDHPDLVPPDWPSVGDIRRLVDRAGNLFIYASTAVKYIGEDPLGNLEALSSTECVAAMLNLEELYTQILAKSVIHKSQTQILIIRRILTAILVACKPMSIPALSTWLNVDAYKIRSMLDQLHSVIRMPGDNAGTVSIFHASFGEFLTSSRVSPDVQVLMSKGHCDFAETCLKFMLSDLHFNVSRSLSSYQPTELLPDTSVVAPSNHNITWQLQYACQYWLDHVIDASIAISDVNSLLNRLELALKKKLLYWIEGLLAMGCLDNCIQMLMRALGTPILLQKMSPSLTTFLRDANEFVILSRDAIKHSPPHIYLSAIPFARPTSSVVRENASRFVCLPRPNVRGLTRAQVPVLLLRAHSGAVNAVGVSPDGNYIASGAGDKSVCKWSSSTGELLLQPFKGHTGEILSIACSPDASQIASGSSDCTIRIWEAQTGQCTLVMTRHTASVMSVIFSNDGARLISGSKDKTILICNVQDGQQTLSPLEGHDEAVTCVAISQDGELIASGSEDCTIRLWNAKTGTVAFQPLRGHDFAVQTIAFSPDGTRIISGSCDWRINVWNSSSGECLIAPLKEHSNIVNSVAFAPDGQHIASCSDDRSILVWDVNTGSLVMQPIVGHADRVLSLAFSPDGKRLVSGSADRTISVWTISNDVRPVDPLEGHTKAVYSVVFSSDGKRILSGSADKTVRIWDACTGKPVMKPLKGHTDDVNCAVFSKDGMRIASCADDHTIRIWHADSGRPDTTMPIITGHTQWVWSVEFSLDGKYIISASKDKTVRIWDTVTGKSTKSLPECHHKDEVKWAVLSPDGKRIASASFDSTICVSSAETGELLLGPLTGHIGWIWALAYSPDGRRIASGGEDHKIQIWDAQKGKVLWTLEGHTNDVQAVAFSPDSSFIVSGSADCTVCLWDVHKGVRVGQPLVGHTDTVRCIAFAPDGRYVVSGSADTTIRVWDLHLVRTPESLLRNNDMVNPTNSAFDLPGTSGWIRGPQGERMMWVVPEYRAFVHDKDLMPQCVLLIATGRVTVNFKDSIHGEGWTKCHVGET